ncbi:hypothetical protein [Streptomyces collinus]|uniref:hypothetical protein n=1 Tax=Streptomyces collinus TaxID=42684 RepID=UPI00381B5AD0
MTACSLWSLWAYASVVLSWLAQVAQGGLRLERRVAAQAGALGAGAGHREEPGPALQIFLLLVGHVRNLAQQRRDHDEEHDREGDRLTGELLARHAHGFPALVRAVADGAFDAPGIDPLDFGLDRILDGVAALTTARE